jgi:lauroyl/myristoyl acyltransferase
MKIRFHLEYALARVGMAVVPRLPRQAAVLIARAFGRAAYTLSAHLRKVGHANLDIAFGPDKTPAEKKAILIESFQTFALMLIDLFWFSRHPRERIETYVHFDESYDAFFAEHSATIAITAHAGNWELLGKAIALKGHPPTSVAAPLKNEKVDRLFNRMREDTGQTIVSKRGAVRALIKTLKNDGKVALLLDQNTKPSDGGIFLDFFGLPVPVSLAVATLARHTGAHLAFGTCLPEAHGHYWMRNYCPIDISDIQDNNRTRLEAAITRRILETIEQQIRQTPEKWLWSYKRWKYTAPGRKRSDYPFYAKEMLDIDKAAAAKTAEAMR